MDDLSCNGLSGYTQLQDFSTLFKRVSELEQVISVLISRIGDDPNAYTELHREDENEGDREVQEDEFEEEDNERAITSEGGGPFGTFEDDRIGQTGRDGGHIGFATDEPQGEPPYGSYPDSNPRELQVQHLDLTRSVGQTQFPNFEQDVDKSRDGGSIPGPSYRGPRVARVDTSGLEGHAPTSGEDDERGAAYRFEVSSLDRLL